MNMSLSKLPEIVKEGKPGMLNISFSQFCSFGITEMKIFYLMKLKLIIVGHPIIREGNGTPRQHSCLENPMDGGAWWAADPMDCRVKHN